MPHIYHNQLLKRKLTGVRMTPPPLKKKKLGEGYSYIIAAMLSVKIYTCIGSKLRTAISFLKSSLYSH